MKNYLLLFTFFLLFGNAFAENKNVVKTKFSEITVTLNDGQVKSGKIKHPYDLNKKIEIILASGEKVKIDNLLVKQVVIKHESGFNLTFQNVTYYASKLRLNYKISKKPKLMLVVMKELLTIYFDNGVSYTNMSANGLITSTNYNNYYAFREGEEAAYLISGYVNGQLNPNVLFKTFASKYFEDYPELSKKIEDKEYKYTDIITVCVEYINWKKSKN
ncbi:hypothetical protein [Flavobacterium sp.]|jgi:hypothetical protein|uniref:hypothetical protein n=1 Tax=Flavobacterium sp. TaxID=239 RepID=UPI002A823F75|nr:hypothetical protein [Flavobacterium sp.]